MNLGSGIFQDNIDDDIESMFSNTIEAHMNEVYDEYNMLSCSDSEEKDENDIDKLRMIDSHRSG